MNVTKIVTILMHHIPVLVTLASHLMMTSCTVMVTCKIGMHIKQILNLFISDIDECTTGFAECNHHCRNTAGNYYCTCYGSGYRLQDDNSTCLSKLAVRL